MKIAYEKPRTIVIALSTVSSFLLPASQGYTTNESFAREMAFDYDDEENNPTGKHKRDVWDDMEDEDSW